jgi:murein L,D-transpeptidase YcbB/YkuD
MEKLTAFLVTLLLLPGIFQPVGASTMDTTVNAAIRKLLASKAEMQIFHYPKSVERFYNQSTNQPAWTVPERDVRKTWEALLLLDCVLQFGLNHADYHPKELVYSAMHDILEKPKTVDPLQKARFDMLLTDALIAFINHLHFGKLNPVYTKAIVDQGDTTGFSADGMLKQAIAKQDFMGTVLSVQPKVKEYVLMQSHMRLLKGQYLDDCYEAPEGIVRKLAINMERLRWAAIDVDTFIHINIPSYTLKLFTPQTNYQFKVIVGKPSNPSPVLHSAITHFSTAPDWKVPKSIFQKEMLPKALKNPAYLTNNNLAIYDRKGNYVPARRENLLMVKKNPDQFYMRQSPGCDNALGLVVFRFQNPYSIYLHDTPEPQLFDLQVRALSHGCIRVQQAQKLAIILLELDGQQHQTKVLNEKVAKFQAKDFILKKPVPIIITYLTCEIGEYGVVEYEDIYKKDKALELALYENNIGSN